MKILKIGGSLITDKSEGAFELAKVDVIENIAKQIEGKLILVHGVGSFGHPHVKKFGLTAEGVSITHNACLRLNSIVCSSLIKSGVNAIPIHPFEFFANPDFGLIKELIEKDFVPVMHGDVVFENGTFRVMSGDEIVGIFAEKFRPESVGFATDTPIVIDGRIVDEINYKGADDILRKVGRAEGKEDVTGGMRGKIEHALKIADICDVYIFNGLEENAVRDFLRGRRVGTRIAKVF